METKYIRRTASCRVHSREEIFRGQEGYDQLYACSGTTCMIYVTVFPLYYLVFLLIIFFEFSLLCHVMSVF